MRSEYTGREIAVKAIRPLIDFLDGYPQTVNGQSRIDTSGERISWDDLCALLDAADALEADLGRIGAEGLASALYQYRRRVRLARGILTLEDALRFILYPRNPIDFACLGTAMQTEPGRIDLVAYLNEGYEQHSAFFEVMRGAAEEITRQYGLPQGAVSLTVSGRQAHYVFTYTPSTGFGSRLRSRISRFFYSAFSLLVIRSAYPYLVQGRKIFEQQLVQRARLEDELVESQEALDRRLKSTDDVICEFDAQGSLVYVSPNLERLVGQSMEQVLADPERLVHPDDLAAVRAGVAQKLADPDGGRIEDFRVFDAAGKSRWVELAFSSVNTRDGARHTIAVARDVSVRRRYRARQEKLDRQLERSRRLEMLGVLAGGIAHDFNNLLVPMLAEADGVRTELEDRPDIQARVAAIESAAQKASDLVRQLMVYSGTEAGSFATIDLAHETRELLPLIKVSVPSRVEFRLHVDDSAPVRGDLSHLRQLILNLVINAVEAIGPGEGAIDLAVRREGDKVRLTVLDDGCGMDQATREQAFEPFFTTKFAGRGLGLSAVIGVVRGHNGELAVDSEPGRGTQIIVSLDALVEGAPSGSEGPALEGPAKGLVLLVDDEEAVRRVGKAMLEAASYRVELACDGEEALAKLERGNYSAIVLDLLMPRIDGRQVLAAVRRSQPRLPVVVVSGYGAQLVGAQVTADPFTRFLSKPFRSKELVGALQEIEASVPD